MYSWKGNIERMTEKNRYYRKVLYTTENTQLVLMSLKAGEEIGMERHNGSQFIRVEKGRGMAIVGGRKYRLRSGDAVIIPKETDHNIINTGEGRLKLYTLYSPPQHKDGEKERRKMD